MKISFGRYFQGDSLLHRMDPRMKVVLCFLFLIAIFSISTFETLAVAAVAVFVLIFVSKLPAKVVFSSIRSVFFLILFILVINIFTTRTGTPLFSRWIVLITDEGLSKAFFMASRLLLLVLSTSIFLTLTTTPLLLADSLESLFGPLKKIRVPVHEMAMMMSIALRFVPTLVEETDKIMKAQASRGAKYDTGSFADRIRGYITVLIPLFISAFKRAEELTYAMEARCYRGGDGRTKLKVLKATRLDWILFVGFIFVCSSFFFLDFFFRIR